MLLFGVLNGEWLSVDWMDMAQEPSIHDNGLGVGHLVVYMFISDSLDLAWLA